jgi:hypothetical protein
LHKFRGESDVQALELEQDRVDDFTQPSAHQWLSNTEEKLSSCA